MQKALNNYIAKKTVFSLLCVKLNVMQVNHLLKQLSVSRKKPFKATSLAFFAVSLLFPHVIFAQSTFPGFSNFSFGGYGTLGYAWLDDKNAEYRTGEGLNGATNEGSFGVDSRLALQLAGAFNSIFSTGAQVIARQNEEGDAGAELEWGFLGIQAADRVAIRVGRMSLPTFSLSDYREVGYASVLLRPPEDVYIQVPLKRFTGADVTVESLVRGTLLTVQLFGGVAREKIFNDLEPELKSIVGLSGWVERGPFKVRANLSTGQIDIDSRSETYDRLRQGIDTTLAVAPQLGATLNPLRDALSGEFTELTFASLGLSADFDDYFLDFEFASRRMGDNWVPDVDSFSIVAGINVGRFSPYGFYSENRGSQPIPLAPLPDLPELAELSAGIDSVFTARSQSTAGVGLRVDISENIALKSQIEFISRDEIGASFFRFSDDGSDTGDDVLLTSFVVDFAF